MIKTTKIKLILAIILLAGVLGTGYYFLSQPKINPNNTASSLSDKLFGWRYPVAKFPEVGSNQNQLAYSDIRDPGGIAQGLPVRLKIPVINVDSAIEDALITPDGRMDVPAGSKNVAWFSLGPHPGQVGSAVIGGHFGISNGIPFVFYNLDSLKVGNKVYIVDDTGASLAFQVRAIKSFDRDADATPVFSSSDGLAHLNLITCEGVWNQINGSYPQRLVIFTDAIASEGAVEVKPKPAAVTKPTSPKVAAALPASTPSAGSPDANPAPLAPETQGSPESTIAPENVKSSPAWLETSIVSTKSLFATPADGLVTTSLLISIGFMGFMVIKPKKLNARN